jgi:phi LC3 family holin
MKGLIFMKINWKARLKNKAFLITFGTLIITFVYQILGLFGVVPSVSEDTFVNIVTIIVNLLASLGILIDPTTPGANDSDRAMTYYTEGDVRNDE